MKSMKSRSQRWEFVSSYLLRMAVSKTPLQCEYRWSCLWKPFKVIYDYEKAIPSGQDSYWSLSTSERTTKKLPRTFDRKVYSSMKDNFATDRAVDPGDILIDSSLANLGSTMNTLSDDDQHTTPNEENHSNNVYSSRSDMEQVCTGKKRSRPFRATGVRKGFQDCTKHLMEIIDVEKERNQSQPEVMEITRSEFETSVKLQQERIVAAQQSSEALMQIASALKLFTTTMGPTA